MEIRTLREADLEQAWQLDRDAFHSSEDHKEVFLRLHDPARLVGGFEGERLVALTGARAFGQFFGGRSVPMGGLSSVSVAPDRRGPGLARAVLEPALAGMRARGEVISSLFPATTRLYRRLGWEVGGSYLWRSVTPRLLQHLPRPAAPIVRPAVPGDLAAVRACYEGFARGVNGFIERSDSWWEYQPEHWSSRSVFVAEDGAGGVAGYLVYRQFDGEYSAFGGPFQLAVEDLVWNTRDAGLALWWLLGSWAPQVSRILYRGPAEDPLLLLLPEQDIAVVAEIRWMTRLVDAVGAVEARGFPQGVDIEVHVALRDEILPANSGDWVLSVRKGRGRLEPGGSGAVQLDVGSLSSLYTGWATTAALARAGLISGGSPEERAALDAAFAGPTPWLLDEF